MKVSRNSVFHLLIIFERGNEKNDVRRNSIHVLLVKDQANNLIVADFITVFQNFPVVNFLVIYKKISRW